MEFIKLDKDTHNILVNGEVVGQILCNRSSSGIRGYYVRFYVTVLGYNYGAYKKNLKEAKKGAEECYKLMLSKLSTFSYYAPEIMMYFGAEDMYTRYKGTGAYMSRLKWVERGADFRSCL